MKRPDIFHPKNKHHLAQLQHGSKPHFSAIAVMYCHVLALPNDDNPELILREATTGTVLQTRRIMKKKVKAWVAKLSAGQLVRVKLYPQSDREGYIRSWDVAAIYAVPDSEIEAPTARVKGSLSRLDKPTKSIFCIWRNLTKGLTPMYLTVWHRNEEQRPRGRQFGCVLAVKVSIEFEPRPRLVFDKVLEVMKARPKRKATKKAKKAIEDIAA